MDNNALQTFLLSIAGQRDKDLRLTSLGIFVREEHLAWLVEEFQKWLKADSGSAGLLEESRAKERLFGDEIPPQYYILDGKNCIVGSIATTDKESKFVASSDLRSKFTIYSGSPIAANNYLHPKDPMLSKLGKVSMTSQGLELHFSVPKVEVTLPVAKLPDIIHVFLSSPRFRRYRTSFKQALRTVIPEFIGLLSKMRRLDPSRLKFIPSQFRKRRDVTFLSLADVVCVLEQGILVFAYGFKGRSLSHILHEEIRGLAQTIRNKHIGSFDLRMSDGRTAGGLKSNEERFTCDYPALMDFVQVQRPARASVRAVYDVLFQLGEDFKSSAWILERDVPRRARAKPRDKMNYRASAELIYWIGKGQRIVAVRSRPKIISKPLVLKHIDEVRAAAQGKSD